MIRRHTRTPIMHRVVEHGGVLYFGGIVADDRSKDMAGQTQDILEKVGQLLQENGSDRTRLLAATIYVTDINQRQGVAKARREHFSGDFPTATTVQVVALADPAYKVEIDAIAHIGKGR